MKLYRICTEDKNRKSVETLLSTSFDGFAIFSGVGYWKGKQEKALTIEIFGDNIGDTVKFVAHCIKVLNNQESVLITEVECKGEFL